jgi:hypothetical protein
MSLEDRQGLLTVNARITSKVFNVTDTNYLITLEALSDNDAVVSGLFYPDGDTVHASREAGQIRLYYAGLRFTKLDAPGCCGREANSFTAKTPSSSPCAKASGDRPREP